MSDGLSAADARRRLAEFGPNEIQREKTITPLTLLLGQFTSPTKLLFAGAACSDAELGADDRAGVGDPTELAILIAAAERGIHRKDIETTRPRVTVVPLCVSGVNDCFSGNSGTVPISQGAGVDATDGVTPKAPPHDCYFTEYLVNAPPAWRIEFGPSAA